MTKAEVLFEEILVLENHLHESMEWLSDPESDIDYSDIAIHHDSEQHLEMLNIELDLLPMDIDFQMMVTMHRLEQIHIPQGV